MPSDTWSSYMFKIMLYNLRHLIVADAWTLNTAVYSICEVNEPELFVCVSSFRLRLYLLANQVEKEMKTRHTIRSHDFCTILNAFTGIHIKHMSSHRGNGHGHYECIPAWIYEATLIWKYVIFTLTIQVISYMIPF